MSGPDDEYITHARELMNADQPQPLEIVIAEAAPASSQLDSPTAEGVAEASADKLIEQVYREAWNNAQ